MPTKGICFFFLIRSSTYVWVPSFCNLLKSIFLGFLDFDFFYGLIGYLPTPGVTLDNFYISSIKVSLFSTDFLGFFLTCSKVSWYYLGVLYYPKLSNLFWKT